MLRVVIAPTAVLLTACFVDAVGGGPGDGGSGPGTTGTEASTTDTSSATMTTSSSTGGSQGGGGQGPGGGGQGGEGGSGPLCVIDGVLGAGEGCEDGNLTPGDGCDANCQLEATCANGQAEGGEPCDDGSVCTAACLGACGSGSPLAMSATVSGNTANGGITPFGGCGPADPGSMVAFRSTTAPHPEGVIAYASGMANGFDPVIWIARDCGANVFDCDAQWSTDGRPAIARTDILPPSTHLVFGVADMEDNEQSFQIYFRTFRYYDSFEQNPAGWTLTGWDSNGDELNTWEDPAGSFAETPPIYVGGIDNIRVVFPYQISSLGSCDVGVSFDGGASNVVTTLPASPNWNYHEASFTVQRPAGASMMRLRFTYSSTSEGVLIDALEVGPSVAGPGF